MKIKIFNNGARLRTALPILCTVCGIGAVIASLFANLTVAVPMCISSLAALALLLKRFSTSPSSVENNTLQFATNLVGNMNSGSDTLKLINDSLNQKFAFYHDVSLSLVHYRRLGDSKAAFANSLHKYSRGLDALLNALALRLDNGIDISERLKRINSDLSREHERSIKSIGFSSNAVAITNAGSTVFFPAFAGISLGIMKATSTIGQQATAAISSMTMLFAGYIFMIGLANFRYSEGNALLKIAKMSAISGIALIILRFCSTLQIGTL